VASIEYLTADLHAPRVMVRMDVTAIDAAEGTFDVILCNHVLEHVTEDRRAMSELHRVLKPGGWAILQVPIRGDVTQEDRSVTDPRERERLYGQYDHVRQYGRDYADRLRDAGFRVTVDGFSRELDAARRTRHGLPGDEDVYVCRKGG
jgi:SAM-dependent methyltransferase